MTFFEFLAFLEECSNEVFSIYSSNSYYKVFTDTLGNTLNDFLQFFYDAPLIGDILESTVGNLIESSVGDVSILSFMINVGVPAFITYSFVKWLVGIVTGS